MTKNCLTDSFLFFSDTVSKLNKNTFIQNIMIPSDGGGGGSK